MSARFLNQGGDGSACREEVLAKRQNDDEDDSDAAREREKDSENQAAQVAHAQAQGEPEQQKTYEARSSSGAGTSHAAGFSVGKCVHGLEQGFCTECPHDLCNCVVCAKLASGQTGMSISSRKYSKLIRLFAQLERNSVVNLEEDNLDRNLEESSSDSDYDPSKDV